MFGVEDIYQGLPYQLQFQLDDGERTMIAQTTKAYFYFQSIETRFAADTIEQSVEEPKSVITTWDGETTNKMPLSFPTLEVYDEEDLLLRKVNFTAVKKVSLSNGVKEV